MRRSLASTRPASAPTRPAEIALGSCPPQDGHPCPGTSVSENDLHAGMGAGVRRPTPLPLSVTPPERTFLDAKTASRLETGDIFQFPPPIYRIFTQPLQSNCLSIRGAPHEEIGFSAEDLKPSGIPFRAAGLDHRALLNSPASPRTRPNSAPILYCRPTVVVAGLRRSA